VTDLVTANTAFKIGIFAFKNGIEIVQSKKRNKIIESLASGRVSIDEDFVQSDSFIISTHRTIEALTIGLGAAKLDMISDMYFNGLNNNLIENNASSYLELLDIVSSLSEREISILIEMDKWSITGVGKRKYASINDHLISELNINNELLQGILSRLQRTGLIIAEGIFGAGFIPSLSGIWGELKDLLYIETGV
jgi:hypothetical protein